MVSLSYTSSTCSVLQGMYAHQWRKSVQKKCAEKMMPRAGNAFPYLQPFRTKLYKHFYCVLIHYWYKYSSFLPGCPCLVKQASCDVSAAFLTLHLSLICERNKFYDFDVCLSSSNRARRDYRQELYFFE